MRLPRMTTRRWLEVVAVTGIVLAVVVSRQSNFLAQEKSFRQRLDASREEVIIWQLRLRSARMPPATPLFPRRPDGDRKLIVDGNSMYFRYVVTPEWRERKEATERAAAKARQKEIARLQGSLQKAQASVAYYDRMSRKYERRSVSLAPGFLNDPPAPE